MRRWMVVLTGVVVVVVVAVGAGLVLRDDAPPPLSIDDIAAGDGGSTSAGLEGQWTIAANSDSQAGLRIVEDRFGGLDDNTAVGRTPAVSGELTVGGDKVTAGMFRIDLSELEFTDDPGISVANRSEYLRTKALETDRFPTATLELAEPLPLPALPASGQVATASITGDFTLHGVTVERRFAVEVKRSGSRIVLATAAPVSVDLADHDIDVPVIEGVSEVRDTGEFEFVVVLRRT